MQIKKKAPRLTYKTSLKEKARQLRNNPTPAEKHFWSSLRKMSFYEKITFNRQKPLGNYIADFYSHQLNLVIEIDGDSHGEISRIDYDVKRTLFFESKGLKVTRFSNREVLNNIEAVMERIGQLAEEELDKSPQPPLKKGGLAPPSMKGAGGI